MEREKVQQALDKRGVDQKSWSLRKHESFATMRINETDCITHKPAR